MKGTFYRGVVQGSSLSPALYNMFMDSFAEAVLNGDMECIIALIMFADDVQLRAKTRHGMQKLLDAAGIWADTHGMTWSIKKCSIIRAPRDSTGMPLKLQGQKIKEVTYAEYLGITMGVDGITHHHLYERIVKAKKRLGQLHNIGLNNHGFDINTNRRLYKTLVRSMTEYQMHLTPISPQVNSIYQAMERQLFKAVTGFQTDRNAWIRKVLQLESIHDRRIKLRDLLQTRLLQCERPENAVLPEVLHRARNLAAATPPTQSWAHADAGKQRVFPLPTDKLAPPLLFKANNLATHRAYAKHWEQKVPRRCNTWNCFRKPS